MRKLEVATVQQMLREQKVEDAAAWEAWAKRQEEVKAENWWADTIDQVEDAIAVLLFFVYIYLLAVIVAMLGE